MRDQDIFTVNYDSVAGEYGRFDFYIDLKVYEILGIVADKLHASGWSWDYCSAVTPLGWRWIVDAHREGRRYIVHSDELLSAFLELEAMLL